jgi:hypothetical protein
VASSRAAQFGTDVSSHEKPAVTVGQYWKDDYDGGIILVLENLSNTKHDPAWSSATRFRCLTDDLSVIKVYDDFIRMLYSLIA